MRRVVVTGLGAITPLGVGIRRTWARLLAGDSGIVSVNHLEPQAQWAELPSRVAGLVPLGGKSEGGWTASDWMSKSEERTLAKYTQYAIAATQEALEDSGWNPTSKAQLEMTGVCMGSGIGNFEEVYNTSIAYRNGVSLQQIVLRIMLRCDRATKKYRHYSFRNYSSILQLDISP